MLSLTLGEITTAVNGTLLRGDAQRVVSGSVQTDSRQISEGGIFFAKLGEKEDGHDYLPDALAKGATLAVVSKYQEQIDINQVLVTDTVEALSQLASFVLERVRSRGQLKVVGITGSNGKTSTKNMLEQDQITAPSNKISLKIEQQVQGSKVSPVAIK